MSPAKVLLEQDAPKLTGSQQQRYAIYSSGDRLPVNNPARYESRVALRRAGGYFESVPR